jgi:hypothetical protein
MSGIPYLLLHGAADCIQKLISVIQPILCTKVITTPIEVIRVVTTEVLQGTTPFFGRTPSLLVLRH